MAEDQGDGGAGGGDSIGLNLVCIDDGATGGRRKGGSGGRKRRRRTAKNKYDKRRERAADARGVGDRHPSRVEGVDGDAQAADEGEGNHPALGSADGSTREAVTKVTTAEVRRIGADEEADECDREEEEVVVVCQRQPTSSSSSRPPPTNVTSSIVRPTSRRAHRRAAKAGNKVDGETPTTADGGGEVADALGDEVERARYMAEFHARPLELDRRNRASSAIKPSRYSSHLFAPDRQTSGIGEDDDDSAAAADGKRGEESEGCPFAMLGLHPRLVRAVTTRDILADSSSSSSGGTTSHMKRPTLIQVDAVPKILAVGTSAARRGRNVCVQSETGSGKTLAYLLPIVQSLAIGHDEDERRDEPAATAPDRRTNGTQFIVLCPTRELATQTTAVATRLLRHSFADRHLVPGCLSGGEKRKAEKARLRRGVAILVATPGRLLDHLTRTECLLDALRGGRLRWLVLDEADRLLGDGGLRGQVEEIVQRLRVTCKAAGGSAGGDGDGDGGRVFNSWRTVLVSATVTPAVQVSAEEVIREKEWIWASARGGGEKDRGAHVTCTKDRDGAASPTEARAVPPREDDRGKGDVDAATDETGLDLSGATPRQLAQLYMVVSAKLRLPALVAFLADRVKRHERTVVFMSTCDSVDFHHSLFSVVDPLFVGSDSGEDVESSLPDETAKKGMFGGAACPLFRLHGNVPHSERQQILKQFSSGEKGDMNIGSKKHQAAILFATDVAARGLNLPGVDWIVQYDPPCETSDFIHRSGRAARAGHAGHALVFLLPSELQYIEVLRLRGLLDVTPLSLSSTLTRAARLCPRVTAEGEKRSGQCSDSRKGEAFSYAVQNLLEECILQDASARKEKKRSSDKKTHGGRRLIKANEGDDEVLIASARRAFASYLRAYPTKEKAIRHIFCARALHLGHVARSFALKDTPKTVKRANRKDKSSASEDGSTKNRSTKKRNLRLAFEADAQPRFSVSNGSRLDVMGGGNGDLHGRSSADLNVPAKVNRDSMGKEETDVVRGKRKKSSHDKVMHSAKEKAPTSAGGTQAAMIAAARRLQSGMDYF